ncbi:MAG: cyclic nucleotide-binding domain-containing protein [Gammaproteobacteria bacterium]
MAVEPSFIQTQHTCEHCVLRQLFVRSGLAGEQIAALGNATIRCHGPYRRGQHIFRAGDQVKSLYVITSGAVKTEITAPSGRQVTGFFLTGESFAAEAIGRDVLPFDAIALRKTTVCELSRTHLEELCAENERLLHEVLRFLSEHIRTSSRQWISMRHLNSEQRVIRFLRDLRRRIALRQGHEPGEIRLPMTKDDISCFLSLAPETLSRTLTKLAKGGVIRNTMKSVELLDREAIETH